MSDGGGASAERVRSASDARDVDTVLAHQALRLHDAVASLPRARVRRRSRASGAIAFIERVGDASVEWAVFEMDARDTPGARGPRCLVFWREQCLRRVWEYPDDWRTLSDVELAALSMHR
ncbi:MAG TPA: hypothetical protein VEA99_08990 [Gemmatimonadaceae bacterium]|nr:hypothetical protein [Gemmatimonadaceae bacterium]